MGTGANQDHPIRDVIADEIRREIMSGRLEPGQRLTEKVLAEEHNVSRVPVREALRRLETEGFVTLTPYQGARVSETSERDSLEVMQTRRALEVFAARLAAERRGGDVADQLMLVVEQGRAAGEQRHVEELPALIMQFHRLVAVAAGNQRLERMLVTMLTATSWGFELDIDARIDSSWSDHAAIAAAILSGAPWQAALIMDEHIARDEQLYIAKYRHQDD